MSKCKSCGQEIKWVLTKNGKKMPVNVSDDSPHWASCEQADQWRKRVKKTE